MNNVSKACSEENILDTKERDFKMLINLSVNEFMKT